jgi:signal transduction histidine kinase/CheY-like chemotaxis protein
VGKVILISTSALVVLCYYKLMQDAPGPFLFYFPIITMFVLFTDVKKEGAYIFAAGAVVLTSYFCAMFIPNAWFKPEPLATALHQFIFIFCTITCAALSILYLYFNFKVNIRNEAILKEASRKAAELAEMKAQFLNNISHELRTPLNGIIGTINILKTEQELHSTDKHFPVLENLSEHMLGLVNNILDHSKISSGKMELNYHWFSFEKWITGIQHLFQIPFNEKQVNFQVHIDPKLMALEVYSDALRLQQVIYNLLSNALKFTAQGTVNLIITLAQKDKDTIHIYFSATDTGIGIPLNKQKRIFESFGQADSATTRKYGGTGLGLSISNDLVELLGGSLQLKSTEGTGSNFYFTIIANYKKVEEEKALVKDLSASMDITNIRVLLAEDNPINSMVAKKLMEKWKVIVTTAMDGKMALNYFQKSTFDLLLIDLEMPEMDGRSTVAAVRAIDKEIPCLAFTAGVYDNMGVELRKIGFTDYVLKPFKPEELRLKIHQYTTAKTML